VLCAQAQPDEKQINQYLKNIKKEKEVIDFFRFVFEESLLKTNTNQHLSSEQQDSIRLFFVQKLEKINDSKDIPIFNKSVAYITLGVYYLSKKQANKGYIFLNKMKNECDPLTSRAYHYYCERYSRLNRQWHKLDSAVFYAERELETAEVLKDDSLVFNATYNLAGILYGIKEYDKSRHYFHQLISHPLIKSEKGFLRTVFNTYALSYQKQELYDSARIFYDTAYKYAEMYEDQPIWRAIIKGNIGDSYFLEGKYQKALPYLFYDLENSLKARNNNMGLNAFNTLNRIFTAYLHLGDLKQAELFRDSIERHIYKDGNRYLIRDFYENSSLYFQKKNDATNAYKYLKSYLALADSIDDVEDVENAKKLEMQYNFEHERKQATMEIATEREKNEQKSNLLITLVVILILSFGLVYTLYRVSRHRKQVNTLLNTQKQDIFAKNEELKQINEELKQTLDIIEKQKSSLTKQAEELQELNHLKDKLFSIISHDLRSPLGALKGMLSILDMGGLSEQELQSISKDVRKRLEGVDTSLNNLLLWSKSQMIGEKSAKESVALHSLVEGKFNLYSANAENKKITLHNLIPKEISILVDSNHLRAILRNLIGNAIKFTPENGKIEVSAVEKESFVEISVKDTGIGMTAEQISNLFDNKTHFTTRGTNNEKGTGLGLLLCKEFVEKEGGRIWVESQIGQGSTFIVALPK
jgi:signal transduction histidine kinase